MKKKRHQAILDLIENKRITTQEELQALLCEKGFDVTQATVSRDIKELMLVKSLGSDGQYKYSVSGKEKNDNSKFKSIFTHSVLNADYAGNICVVKCFAGTASAACAAIDSNSEEFSTIVGTIAGDDSFFILCRTPLDAENLCTRIKRMIEE